MTNSPLQIAAATGDDISGILDLQERNMRDNGGALSVRWPRDWFATAIRDMPVMVARDGEKVVGYVVSTPLSAQAHDPLIQAMLRAYPCAPDAYNYGPICVAESHRGHGLALALFEALRAQLPGREGFTFIRADNIASRKAHARMGMRDVAKFRHGDAVYIVVAYQG